MFKGYMFAYKWWWTSRLNVSPVTHLTKETHKDAGLSLCGWDIRDWTIGETIPAASRLCKRCARRYDKETGER